MKRQPEELTGIRAISGVTFAHQERASLAAPPVKQTVLYPWVGRCPEEEMATYSGILA